MGNFYFVNLQYSLNKHFSILNEIGTAQLNLLDLHTQDIASNNYLQNNLWTRYSFGENKLRPYIQAGVSTLVSEKINIQGTLGLGAEFKHNKTTFHLSLNTSGIFQNLKIISAKTPYGENAIQKQNFVINQINFGLSYNFASSISYKNSLKGK